MPAVLRERQGVVVLRPAPDALVAVEFGARAAGHGHPDALHLTLARGGLLLGDFGTGAYVSPSLHWYRSTLAHNAPGLAGRGQAPVAGVCDGVGSADGCSWCRVYADGLLGPGTWARRTVVAGPAWVLDAVSVNVPPDVVVDLPVHPLAGLAASVSPGVPTSPTQRPTPGMKRDTPMSAIYAATKSATRSMARSVAQEIPPGVPVHAFSFVPGIVDTPLIHDVLVPQMSRVMGLPENVLLAGLAQNPGYPGLLPPDHCATALVYCMAHAEEYNAQVADPFAPLQRFGLISVPKPEAGNLRAIDVAGAVSQDVKYYLLGLTD